MFDHSLESSYRDESSKWSEVGFDREIAQVGLIGVSFSDLIWCPAFKLDTYSHVSK